MIAYPWAVDVLKERENLCLHREGLMCLSFSQPCVEANQCVAWPNLCLHPERLMCLYFAEPCLAEPNLCPPLEAAVPIFSAAFCCFAACGLAGGIVYDVIKKEKITERINQMIYD